MEETLLGVELSTTAGSLTLRGSEVIPLVVTSCPGEGISDPSLLLTSSSSSSSVTSSFLSGMSSTTTFTDSIIILVLVLNTLYALLVVEYPKNIPSSLLGSIFLLCSLSVNM